MSCIRTPVRHRSLAIILVGVVVMSVVWSRQLLATGSPRLDTVKSFAFAIGDGCLDGDVGDKLGAFDLVIVDGEAVTVEQVRTLHQHGVLVLAYLSVGTIENWRWWYKAVKRYRLDYWGDWGEWYADTSKAGYRKVLRNRVAPWMLAKGIDGLFLDNTDMISDHPRQAPGMRKLVHALSLLVHGRNGFLFSQNGEEVIGPSLADYDGWNREDVTSTYDFDNDRYLLQGPEDVQAALDALRKVSGAGLLVMATDYAAGGDSATEQKAISNACSAGALPYVSDIGLTRIPEGPFTCP
ncbi:MAG: endo alpha-1,4 polygalactosaminidase [Acidobacteriota bacterium]